MKICASGVLVGILSLTACGTGADSTTTAPPSVLADQTGEIRDMWDKPPLEPVEPGTYFLDPDLDPSTPCAWCTTSNRTDGRCGQVRSSSRVTDT